METFCCFGNGKVLTINGKIKLLDYFDFPCSLPPAEAHTETEFD